MRENWFEVDTEDFRSDDRVVTYVKYWKLALLKWIVIPPMTVVFWLFIIPFTLIKQFLVGGWNDLSWELRNFDDHKVMIQLFQWYRAPIKRIDKSVK